MYISEESINCSSEIQSFPWKSKLGGKSQMRRNRQSGTTKDCFIYILGSSNSNPITF